MSEIFVNDRSLFSLNVKQKVNYIHFIEKKVFFVCGRVSNLTRYGVIREELEEEEENRVGGLITSRPVVKITSADFVLPILLLRKCTMLLSQQALWRNLHLHSVNI
jgi:hypothetical protein